MDMKSSDRFLKLLSVLNLILLVWLVFYLGGNIRNSETLEDRLEYRKPDVNYDVADLKDEAKANMVKNYTYIPTYSHIYANKGQPILLESTLSIRNTDPSQALRIHRVEYFSSNGESIKRYAEKPFLMSALTSVEYLSEKWNEKGGVGAYFIVEWSSDNANAKPIMESVMINSSADKQISFASRGEEMPFAYSGDN